MRTRFAAVLALAALLAAAPAALAHQGNPNFISQVDAITPATKGVTVDVLNRDDRLLLHNTSGEDVVIHGYSGEPYARVLADGSVQVNLRSPARYLNDDRFARVAVPKGIDGKGRLAGRRSRARAGSSGTTTASTGWPRRCRRRCATRAPGPRSSTGASRSRSAAARARSPGRCSGPRRPRAGRRWAPCSCSRESLSLPFLVVLLVRRRRRAPVEAW